MDQSSNVGGCSVYGQFILDVDLQGRGGAVLTEDQSREVAHALSEALAGILEKVSGGGVSIKSEVLCGWRVWGFDPAPPLSCDLVQLPVVLEVDGVEVHRKATAVLRVIWFSACGLMVRFSVGPLRAKPFNMLLVTV